jgi:flavin-binding protein dodecin
MGVLDHAGATIFPRPGAPCRSRGGGHMLKEPSRGDTMSVYKVIDIIGTSTTSWEEAAAEAVKTAGQSIRDIRVAEVVEQDIALDESGAITFRTKLQISFKYQPGPQ